MFAPESVIKFAVLYAMLAGVAGVSDFFRLEFAQQSPEWLPSSPFVRSVIRGHLLTLLLIFLGAGAAFLLDIDTGWPVVLGFLCGPVTGRSLALFAEFTKHLVTSVLFLVLEVGFSLGVLLLVLAVIRGR